MKYIKLFETYFEDLSICTYGLFPKECGVKSIGWLEKGKEFNRGEVDPKIVEKLKTHKPGSLYMGYHNCEFCDDKNAKCCSDILIVNKDGQIYQCPKLIIHYIEDHNYLPPQEFLDAVENGYFYGEPEFNKYAKDTLDILRRKLKEDREKR